MRTRRIGAAALAGGLLALPFAGCAEAQGAAGQEAIAARVRRAPDGEVRMHFTSRPGVCGSVDGHNISIQDRRRGGTIMHRGTWSGHRDSDCIEGPTHVRLLVRGGRVADVSTRVAHDWPRGDAGRVTDLGRVGAREAADYLLDLAERSDDGDAGKEAIFPATLADSVVTWPRLLRIARSGAAGNESRKAAVFWLSQQAGDQVTRGISDLVDDDDQDREVREAAVFALSQRPRDESVPALIRIARTHRDPHIRKTALFWLGQSRDPRAIELFEEILSQ
jgi:HEAT repeat protein